ncbi:hypothetical protein [Caballeronia sp. ATUFL_M2_KS44]|uniref:hypothetical protein n=1 Tax=Caballeronia sp. ATUFL_M2_KS44 TaxID=2921767 RepID=UPI0020290384|nr:hypothetical protein [Caballeronia sp. ATUFL_M2_KS44]
MGKVLAFAPRPRMPGPLGDEQLQLIAAGRATHGALNITTPRTVQRGYGTLCRVFVITMPTNGVRIYDAATMAEATPENLVLECTTLPSQGMIALDWPCMRGITIDPGDGGHVTATFN